MLASLATVAPDPLWGLTAAFRADPRPDKVDLVVGVYRDDAGQTPVMSAVKAAEERLAAAGASKAYRGLAGNTEFNAALATLLLGNDAGRLARQHTMQTVGGTGALRLLADFIAVASPGARVWVSDPGYVNHVPIMRAAGLAVDRYRWRAEGGVLDADAMFADLWAARAGDIVLLHGCCHNPTGLDMGIEVWQSVAERCAKQGLIPLVDMAYLGLADGLEQDAAGLRLMADALDTVLVAASCSKSMGLYCERTGAAMVIGKNRGALQPVGGVLERITRSNYSMPPDHGAAIVAAILGDAALTACWRDELEHMRQRIVGNRRRLDDALASLGAPVALQNLSRHKGMFSMLPLDADAMERLRTDHAIYGTQGGRINIAGLAPAQIDRVAGALVAVASDMACALA
ncbi:amino acid aminotransferase [Ralstonia flatus]|uniref:Aspartate aminotransferase n=1 Tax=Ralstonia flatus TaxID=3058601 RepID=A0AAD2F4U5_9RALS|nr:amino acid aminotransferase [Ralstonia sp. LMG 32965]MBN6211847.1 aspartate/tyrosine/aromatic aminotransferase [Ralstonia pickettii]CAJ0865749.1 Aspartate aminotransferase [Ralstonia sp. LMG 32965]CAJ0873174.1 Aspartate aminotransferase [Ralstonia sp. LMG 32965]